MSYSFASIYDKIYSLQARRYAQLLYEIIEKYYPSTRYILDLGCGTLLIEANLPKKFKFVGIDASSFMLKEAKKKKLKNVVLIKSDIRKFKLRKSFDVVISLNDTINHLLSLREIRKVFKNVKKVLKSNGLFVFDINTEESLRYYLPKKLSNWIVFSDEGRKEVLVYRKFKERKFLIWEIYYFTNNGTIKKEIIRERVYNIKEIKHTLLREGFNILEELLLKKGKVLIVSVFKLN